MAKICILILSLTFLVQNARAEELSVYQAWNERLLDNPIQALEELKTLREAAKAQKDFSSWVQLTIVLARDANIIDAKAQPGKDELAEALRYADQMQLMDAKLILEYEESGRDDSKAQALIDRAADLKLPRTRALLLNSRSAEYFYKGRYADSLQTAREALRIMQEIAKPDDPDIITLKNDLATVLDYLGDFKQSRVLYEEIVATTEKKSFRYIGSVIAYNYATLLRDDPAASSKAEQLYQRTIRIMESIHENVIRALAKKGLAEILIKKGQLESGQALIRETQETLEKENVLPDAVADSWRLLAKTYMLQRKWQEGMDALKKARIPQLADNRQYQSDLYRLEADGWHGLKEHEKSYQAARKAAELLRDQMKADRQGEIAKLSVQLGLELEVQRSALLTKENEIQAQKIRESSLVKRALMGVSALSALAFLLLIVTFFLLRQVTRSRRHMKRILDNIEEGFVTIDSNLHCRTDLSPFMEKLLKKTQKELQDVDVLAALLERSQLSQDQAQVVRAAVQACLGEDELSWELNEAHLPQELALDERQIFVALHWQVLKRSQRTRFMLLSIRDITERQRIQQNLRQAQERVAHIEALSQELWESDLNQIVKFFTEIKLAWDFPSGSELRAKDRRQLHTWKGNARTLGLRSLANAIHNTEADPMYLPRLADLIKVYESLLSRVKSLGALPSHRTSLWTKIDEAERDLRTLLQTNQLQWQGFSCEDTFGLWNEKLLKLVGVVLVHGTSNAVDHGFVRPRSRGLKVENAVCIRFHARLVAHELCLDLEDNGAGLDEKHLSQIADMRGFRPQEDQSVADVLFEDGVTTSENVTATSGRGVGLSAIRDAAEELGGRCRLTRAARGGTRLRIFIPDPLRQNDLVAS